MIADLDESIMIEKVSRIYISVCISSGELIGTDTDSDSDNEEPITLLDVL
jgi:hypothetical protein